MTYGFSDAVETEKPVDAACLGCDQYDKVNACCTQDSNFDDDDGGYDDAQEEDDDVEDEDTGFDDDDSDEDGGFADDSEDTGFADDETTVDCSCGCSSAPERLLILSALDSEYIGSFLSNDWANALELMAEYVRGRDIESFDVIRPSVDDLDEFEVVEHVYLQNRQANYI